VLEKTRGIVLHTVRYGDKSLILNMYTEQFGRQSYIVNAARGTASKNKAGLLQPLFIVDLDIYLKKSRELQRIKEVKLHVPYTSIPFDIVKTAQTLFIAEILTKIVMEEEHNSGLFRFMESSFRYFDLMEDGKSVFHIWFLAHLTSYLGIIPSTWGNGWLDMHKGAMVAGEPPHPDYMNPETATLFKVISEMPIGELAGFKTTQASKRVLLNKIMEYYTLHFGNLSALKSSDILKSVFQ
jgi:DNA repair protein RecO (recombination protein O)